MLRATLQAEWWTNNTLRMSARGQGGGEAGTAAAPAPAPAAGGQENERHALEEEMRKLTAKIEKLEVKIEADEAKADAIESEAERTELRRSIAADKERLIGLEQDRRDLRRKIEQLSAPAGQPIAAGGCSFPRANLQPCVTACLALQCACAPFREFLLTDAPVRRLSRCRLFGDDP